MELPGKRVTSGESLQPSASGSCARTSEAKEKKTRSTESRTGMNGFVLIATAYTPPFLISTNSPVKKEVDEGVNYLVMRARYLPLLMFLATGGWALTLAAQAPVIARDQPGRWVIRDS